MDSQENSEPQIQRWRLPFPRVTFKEVPKNVPIPHSVPLDSPVWKSVNICMVYHGIPSGKRSKTMERSTVFLMGKIIFSMAIFNSYVKLPEGKCDERRKKKNLGVAAKGIFVCLCDIGRVSAQVLQQTSWHYQAHKPQADFELGKPWPKAWFLNFTPLDLP